MSTTSLAALAAEPRVTIRRAGAPDPDGHAVVCWMQRAQRAADNPALDVAIHAANALKLPLVVFFGLTPAYPNANRCHYAFLADGLPGIEHDLHTRRAGASAVTSAGGAARDGVPSAAAALGCRGWGCSRTGPAARNSGCSESRCSLQMPRVPGVGAVPSIGC